MKSIRKGNDIHIKWWLVIDYGRVKLSESNIQVMITDSSGHSTPLKHVVTNDEYIELDYRGILHGKLGKYTLTAWINKGQYGQAVVDQCDVFKLVACSHEECGSDNSNINTETVCIESHVFVGVSGLDIDENGVLTYNGKRYQLTAIEGTPVITSVEYSSPVVSLSYQKASASGGTLIPTLTYSQTKTSHLSDGSTQSETITSGATIVWENADADGKVVVPSSIVTSEHDVVTVKAVVTLNGRTAEATYTIRQSAYVPTVTYDYYIGQMTKTKSEFTALSDNDLITSLSKKTISANKSDSFKATQNCVVLLVPATLSLSKFQYTSGGMTTNVLADNMWNLDHADVTVNGKAYKVYGYRFNGVTESDPLTYDYSIKIA